MARGSIGSGTALELDRGQGIPAVPWDGFSSQILTGYRKETLVRLHALFIGTGGAGRCLSGESPRPPAALCTSKEALIVILKIGGNSNWKAPQG